MKTINLGNGKVRLVPDKGKTLYCGLDKLEHSEAIVEQSKTRFFEEVSIESQGTTPRTS